MRPQGDKAYWDKMSSHYDEHTERSAAMYDDLIQRVKLEVSPRAVVLDIGTGTGEIPLRISSDVSRIEAVDCSAEMIRRAQDKAIQREAKNVTFRVQDSTLLQYGSCEFDVVILANLLHVVSTPERVLAEAFRVLRQDGKLIAPTFVHAESPKTRLISWILRRKGHPIYTRFDSSTLKAFVEGHGFVVTQQVLLRNIMPVSFIAARKAPQSGGSAVD
jgi:phosphatidylethanolamine/phosphatidyl-N-methylethanolamine N-methyltransferase